MKKDELLKYLMRNQKVFHLGEQNVPFVNQICKTYECDVNCVFTTIFLIPGDYLVTDDSIGLDPDFLILYPEGHMLFFTLIE